MGYRFIRALWGDFNREELKKFVLLAIGFFFLIGAYWPLKVLKDAVFINMVGSKFQPTAKILSLVLFFPIVLVYSRLVDYFSKEKLIYLFVGLYVSLGLLFVYLLAHPSIGVANLEQSPYRIVGWAYYLYVESYISVMVSLYWAFISDITTPESANRGYGILIFGSQFGAVVFVLLASYLSSDPTLYANRVPVIALISVLMLLMVAAVAFIMTHVVSRDQLQGYQEKKGIVEKVASLVSEEKPSVGFFDGLRTLVSIPYVGGIFGLVFFHEVVSALMYYLMLNSVEATYVASQGLVNKFLFNFTLGMQIISCLFALFGTSYFHRKIGVRGCLVAYPMLLGCGIIFYFLHPTLMSIAIVMVIAKGINYVLNQPAKEMLYIPTTKAVKYKAKAWIDMFGMRSAKMGGSLVNITVGIAARMTSGISLLLVLSWILLSRTVGKHYQRVVAKGERIGN